MPGHLPPTLVCYEYNLLDFLLVVLKKEKVDEERTAYSIHKKGQLPLISLSRNIVRMIMLLLPMSMSYIDIVEALWKFCLFYFV